MTLPDLEKLNVRRVKPHFPPELTRFLLHTMTAMANTL